MSFILNNIKLLDLLVLIFVLWRSKICWKGYIPPEQVVICVTGYNLVTQKIIRNKCTIVHSYLGVWLCSLCITNDPYFGPNLYSCISYIEPIKVIRWSIDKFFLVDPAEFLENYQTSYLCYTWLEWIDMLKSITESGHIINSEAYISSLASFIQENSTLIHSFNFHLEWEYRRVQKSTDLQYADLCTSLY